MGSEESVDAVKDAVVDLGESIEGLEETDGSSFDGKGGGEEKESFFGLLLLGMCFGWGPHVAIWDEAWIDKDGDVFFLFETGQHPGEDFVFEFPGTVFVSEEAGDFFDEGVETDGNSGPFAQDAGFGFDETMKDVRKTSLQTRVGTNTKQLGNTNQVCGAHGRLLSGIKLSDWNHLAFKAAALQALFKSQEKRADGCIFFARKHRFIMDFPATRSERS